MALFHFNMHLYIMDRLIHKRTRALFAFVLLLMAFTSCNKEAIDYELFGPEYYPLKTGNYIIYTVDSIHFYDVTLTSDTFTYELKELVDTLITDWNGNSSYVIKRFIRTDQNQAWQLKRVWSAQVYDDRAERQEENLRFMKLNFPVIRNKSWRGNVYITPDSAHNYAPDWLYTYTNIDTTLILNGEKLDSCIVIEQYNEQNQIEKHIEREMYQIGTGMVFKESVFVGRQTINTQNWIPEKGRIVRYRFLEKNY